MIKPGDLFLCDDDPATVSNVHLSNGVYADVIDVYTSRTLRYVSVAYLKPFEVIVKNTIRDNKKTLLVPHGCRLPVIEMRLDTDRRSAEKRLVGVFAIYRQRRVYVM